jgi:hypothetical protein
VGQNNLAASAPQLGWLVEVKDDNGLIVEVRGVRVAPSES